ncbi:MAG TPA: hypothetical protein VGL81_10740 [Polyangiaceae bacterium]|jgi:hypothetical protein
MKLTAPRGLSFCLFAFLALAAAPAVGAPADVARAQRLARQAAALEQTGDLTAAQDVLAQAVALDAAPDLALALARVRAKLGRLVEAREALVSVAYGAAPVPGSAGSSARREAIQMFSDLGSRIPRIRLVLRGAPGKRSVSWTIDGESLPDGAERLPVPVDPGHHVVTAGAPGMLTQSAGFDAVESTEQTITLDLVAPPPPPPPPPPLRPPSSFATPVAAMTPAVDGGEGFAAARRAKFSAGRFFLESLGSAVVGSLAAYGTFKAACGDQPCLGGGLEALGVNVVVTPITVWGLGMASGGDGGLGWAFLGGLVAFSGYTAGTTDPTLPLVIGVVLMPFTSALLYEVSSNTNARRLLGPQGSFAPTLSPLYGPSNGVVGATGGVQGRF